MKRIQYTKGTKLGELIYLEDAPTGTAERRQAKFQCKCGNVFIAMVKCAKSYNTTSCGCLKHEILIDRNLSHGQTKTQLYMVYEGMLARCYNKNNISYPRYGGRGITVSDEWRKSFVNFYNDMGERPKGYTIERKDNNKGYSKENCKWATQKEQCRNMRSNRLITIKGETKCTVEWAEQFGINVTIVNKRLHRDWDIEKALTKPPRKHRQLKPAT